MTTKDCIATEDEGLRPAEIVDASHPSLDVFGRPWTAGAEIEKAANYEPFCRVGRSRFLTVTPKVPPPARFQS
jgi:hypothetical protein